MDHKQAVKIMADIWANSVAYSVSYACLSGEHDKCKSICECKCHKVNN
jgi:hypothetical protein